MTMPLYCEPKPAPYPVLDFRFAGSLMLAVVLLPLLVVVSCSDGSDPDADFPPMEFDISQDLLSANLQVDETFSMQIPVGWFELDDKAFNAAQEVISGDTLAFFKLEPLKIFRSMSGAACVISSVVDNPPLFDLLDAGYKESLKLTFASEDVARGSFSVNGIKTVQYRIISEEIIAFKLFCRFDDRYYQIDYVIPAGIYGTEVHNVESSIGSIGTSD